MRFRVKEKEASGRLQSYAKLTLNGDRHFSFECLSDFILRAGRWQQWESAYKPPGDFLATLLQKATCPACVLHLADTAKHTHIPEATGLKSLFSYKLVLPGWQDTQTRRGERTAQSKTWRIQEVKVL
eukprot:283792-Pelagomonas_calceolata.AAC.9